MTLEAYEKQLDMWAGEERQRAAQAKKAGDEREHSICLMKASMLGDMLKVLGKFEMTRGKKGLLKKEIVFLMREEERLKDIEDYDAAERSRIKADTIRRAWKLIYGEEE